MKNSHVSIIHYSIGGIIIIFLIIRELIYQGKLIHETANDKTLPWCALLLPKLEVNYKNSVNNWCVKFTRGSVHLYREVTMFTKHLVCETIVIGNVTPGLLSEITCANSYSKYIGKHNSYNPQKNKKILIILSGQKQSLLAM